MNYTENYQLKKPERNEQFNLDDWNYNTDTIDNRMKLNQTKSETNANNIDVLLNNLTTKDKITDTSSTFYKLMKLIYPVGSIYWSANSTNPSSLFGGTWTQIKDKFILAAGDTYKVNTTGGNASVTLTINNMPSHNHSMSHTHTFSGTTSGMSENATGEIEWASRSVSVLSFNNNDGSKVKYSTGNLSFGETSHISPNYNWSVSHESLDGTRHTIKSNVSHTHTFSGTTSNTTSNSGSSGSGTSFSILPPYIVKYCFQRTN